MNFKTALSNWLTLQGVGRKPATQLYLAEIFRIISNRWPDHEQDVSTVTETDICNFIPHVAHYSAPRFNAVAAALKKLFPLAARNLRFRPVRIRHREPVAQLQFARLLAELDSRPRSQAALVVNFLAHTGLRIGEARKLLWSDVGVDGIHLRGETAKNGRARFVPFVNGVADVLARLRRVGDGNHVLPQASVKTSLGRACGVVGVPHLSHHDFRHLFATRCIESGVDMPTAARWLGHQDGGALLGKVYFHLADAHSRKMAGKVEI